MLKKPLQLSEEAKEARNAYYRAWRQKNRDKVRKNNQRYWEKKANKSKEDKINGE